jgi:hypothetical protein
LFQISRFSMLVLGKNPAFPFMEWTKAVIFKILKKFEAETCSLKLNKFTSKILIYSSNRIF